jgi:FkbM family methyltransferase
MSLRRAAQFHLAKWPDLYRAVLALRKRTKSKNCYLRLIRRGDIVVDAGANVGDTLLLSDLVGPSGTVHAFEPIESNFAELRRRIKELAGHRNYRLRPNVLAEKGAGVTIYFPEMDPAQASLRIQTKRSWQMSGLHRSQAVSQITLDTCCARLPRLDFLKCDVEGAELLLLQGGKDTLILSLPKLVVELNPDWSGSFGYTPADTLAFLRSCGYRQFWDIEKTWIPLKSDHWVVGNVLCLP